MRKQGADDAADLLHSPGAGTKQCRFRIDAGLGQRRTVSRHPLERGCGVGMAADSTLGRLAIVRIHFRQRATVH